jgi:hypothetical protein
MEWMNPLLLCFVLQECYEKVNSVQRRAFDYWGDFVDYCGLDGWYGFVSRFGATGFTGSGFVGRVGSTS